MLFERIPFPYHAADLPDPSASRSSHQSPNFGPRMIRWFIFIVVVALLPFVLDAVFQWLLPDRSKPTFISVLGKGHLFIAILAIAADGVSELVGFSSSHKVLVWITASCCFVIAVVAAGVYALAAATGSEESTVLTEGSLWLFGITAVVSLACKWGAG
jgi:hypothetical protein